MKWDYWIKLYLQTHCTARGLRTSSINAYHATLGGFREYAAEQFGERGPEQITARDVLEYLDYLRRERDNGASAINRQVTVLRNFYRAISVQKMGWAASKMEGSASWRAACLGELRMSANY